MATVIFMRSHENLEYLVTRKKCVEKLLKILPNIKLHFYFGMAHRQGDVSMKQLKMKEDLPWTRSVSQSFTVSPPKLQAAFIKQAGVTPVSLWFNLP